MSVGIYKIVNKVNNKIYIGSSLNIKRRLIAHKTKLNCNIHSNTHLQNAVNKYGLYNFEFLLIEECNNNNLLEREQYWIELTNCNNSLIGYNKRLIAESNSGYTFSMPESAKEILRLKGIERGKTIEFRKFMSNLHKDKSVSLETRLKSSISHTNYKMKEESKLKISNSISKPILNLDTNILYKNIGECANNLGVNRATIYNWLLGKYTSKVNLKRA